MLTLRLLLWASLTVVVSTPALSAQQRLESGRRLNGERFQGRLRGIDGDWNIRFADSRSQAFSLSSQQLVSWGQFEERFKGSLILLTDGSWLNADVLKLTADDILVESAYWLESKIPLEAVHGVILKTPTDSSKRDHLIDRILKAKGGQDQLLLANDRIATGTIVPSDGQAGFEKIAIRPKGDNKSVSVNLKQVIAIIFNPALAASSGRDARAVVGFRDGTRLHMKRIAASDGQLRCQLSCGIELGFEPSASRPDVWEWVTELRLTNQRVKYLSDIEPLAYRHQPFLSLQWGYGRDRNVLGGRLRHGAKYHSKGLGMHSRSRLAYELNARYQRFEATLAIDDAAGKLGSVVCRVYTQKQDDAGKPAGWRVAYQSPIIRGRQEGQPLSVDLQGVHRMALIVDYGDRGDERDYLNWLDARLIR